LAGDGLALNGLALASNGCGLQVYDKYDKSSASEVTDMLALYKLDYYYFGPPAQSRRR